MPALIDRGERHRCEFFGQQVGRQAAELLSELAPGALTLGMLVDPNNPNAEADTKDAQVAADALGRKLLVVKAVAESDLDAAFATLAQMQVANLFVAANVNFIAWRDQIIALAMRRGIAASYTTRDFVMAGGLMSYGPDQKKKYFAKSAFMQAASSRPPSPQTCL